ncbi:Major facilitator superfamily,Major facilitator superfamily domain [Cinara cedri]|uniref:Lysosomal dipeptide transporter MFSD1 n=1 Tax=Cinara cedri TaxID=506608 RepID=A0A5E4MAH7_9HEMI|nr:Major facilitator superfamily,Major facilitator superfamily domain [Cinara cedri]
MAEQVVSTEQIAEQFESTEQMAEQAVSTEQMAEQFESTEQMVEQGVSTIVINNQKDIKIAWKYPSDIFQRLLALFFMFLIGFGSYFCFDIPSALQENLIQDLNLSTTQFLYLNSWYSWLNVIMCTIGGLLIDSVSRTHISTIKCAVLVALGQIIFAFGAFVNIFWVMLLGRFIFRIGGEWLAIAQNNYAVLWFKGKELNMVFGFQLSFARFGSTVNFIVMKPLYGYVKNRISYHCPNYESLSIVLLLASLTCVLSLLSALLLAWQDKRAEKLLHFRVLDATEVVQIKDTKNLPKIFWLVMLIIVCYYSTIFPLVVLGEVFFERKYNFSLDEAKFTTRIVYTISALCAPFFGLVIDKTGRNLFWVFLSIFGTLVSHMVLTFTFVNPYIAMFIMGLSYSILASALWSLIALIIPEHQMGTAYGITQSAKNFGLAVVALMTGIIVETNDYYMMGLCFCLLISVSLLLTAILCSLDFKNNGILNMSINQILLKSKKTPPPEKQTLLQDNDKCKED